MDSTSSTQKPLSVILDEIAHAIDREDEDCQASGTYAPLLVKALRRSMELIAYAQKVFPEHYANWDTACFEELTAILNQDEKRDKDLGKRGATP